MVRKRHIIIGLAAAALAILPPSYVAMMMRRHSLSILKARR